MALDPERGGPRSRMGDQSIQGLLDDALRTDLSDVSTRRDVRESGENQNLSAGHVRCADERQAQREGGGEDGEDAPGSEKSAPVGRPRSLSERRPKGADGVGRNAEHPGVRAWHLDPGFPQPASALPRGFEKSNALSAERRFFPQSRRSLSYRR